MPVVPKEDRKTHYQESSWDERVAAGFFFFGVFLAAFAKSLEGSGSGAGACERPTSQVPQQSHESC